MTDDPCCYGWQTSGARTHEVDCPLRNPTCREYLGRESGYCDGAVQTHDEHGRGFCTDHAKERGF